MGRNRQTQEMEGKMCYNFFDCFSFPSHLEQLTVPSPPPTPPQCMERRASPECLVFNVYSTERASTPQRVTFYHLRNTVLELSGDEEQHPNQRFPAPPPPPQLLLLKKWQESHSLESFLQLLKLLSPTPVTN